MEGAAIGKEGDLDRAIARAIEKVGGQVLKIHGHAMQEAGWPDLQVYHRTWTGHLEDKFLDRQATALQRIRIRQLRSCGVHACVLRWNQGRLTLEDERGTVEASARWPMDGEQLLEWLAEARKEWLNGG